MAEDLMNEAGKISIALQDEKKIEDKISSKKEYSFIVTGEELLEMKIEDLPYMVKGLLPKTGTIAFAGSSDSGKSSFLRQLACSIVKQEKDFLGYEISATHHNVIYVSTEDDINAVGYLLNKQLHEEKVPSELKNLRFIFESDDILDKLDKALTSIPADCVIIDTFTDIYGGDLNASNKVRSFINDFSNLSKKHNCLFIFLHHTGKRTEMQPPSKDNLLGSQGFEARMRLVFELRKDYSDSTKRHLCVVKGNYVPEKGKEESCVLLFDNNMVYTNTGQHVPFHLLVKPELMKQENTEAKVIVMELKKQGLSISKIKAEMDKKGLNFSRSAIGNWVKNCPPVQSPLTEGVDGQTEEDLDECPSIQSHLEETEDGQSKVA